MELFEFYGAQAATKICFQTDDRCLPRFQWHRLYYIISGAVPASSFIHKVLTLTLALFLYILSTIILPDLELKRCDWFRWSLAGRTTLGRQPVTARQSESSRLPVCCV